MSVLPGTRFGPHEIISRIAAGGMGEVYRARDQRIGREVAIKILPAQFSQDTALLKTEWMMSTVGGSIMW